MSKIITHLQKEFYRNFEYLTNRQERRIAWDDQSCLPQAHGFIRGLGKP